MKRVYLYLKDGSYTCYADIPDSVPLPPLSTLLPVPDGMKHPMFKDDKWQEKPVDKQLKYSDILAPLPTKTEKLLMRQSQQITILQAMTMQQDQANTKLQATSSQQASQIKQLQQMFMTANHQQAVEKAKEVTAQ